MNFRCIGKVKFKSEKQAKLAARLKTIELGTSVTTVNTSMSVGDTNENV